METFLQIPDKILSISELDGDNKILLSKIIQLDRLPDGCFASNNELTKILGMSRTSVSKRISKLKKLGYILTQELTKNNRTKRYIIPTQKWSGLVPQVQGVSSRSSKG